MMVNDTVRDPDENTQKRFCESSSQTGMICYKKREHDRERELENGDWKEEK